MKVKIKIIDKVNNKVNEGEKEIRRQDHFAIQLKYHANIYKNKRYIQEK